MKIYTTQLKKSIREKLESINDTEYLASLDAILTYEVISPDGKMPAGKKEKKFFLKKFWPFIPVS
ncbi:MAG: hypothetical protein HY064_11885 [Bacteroidetes bacterium]|nr:hypothetical protein [Bacteroidota bacterium]